MKENPNQNMQNNQNGGNKELMAFLAERFDMIDKRFDANDQRFDAIDKRFDANNQRFDAIDKRFDANDQRFDAIDKRFDANNQRFDAIDKRFDINDQRFDSVDKNLVVLQNQFDKKLNAFQDRNILDYKELADLMAGQFEKVYEILNQKPDKSEVEAMIKTEVGRVMDRVVRQNDKIDDGRAEQIGMKRQLGKHEKWFSKVATKVGIKLQPE